MVCIRWRTHRRCQWAFKKEGMDVLYEVLPLPAELVDMIYHWFMVGIHNDKMKKMNEEYKDKFWFEGYSKWPGLWARVCPHVNRNFTNSVKQQRVYTEKNTSLICHYVYCKCCPNRYLKCMYAAQVTRFCAECGETTRLPFDQRFCRWCWGAEMARQLFEE